jgi:hypothetical protein
LVYFREENRIMLRTFAIGLVALLMLSMTSYASVSAIGGGSTPSPVQEQSPTPTPTSAEDADDEQDGTADAHDDADDDENDNDGTDGDDDGESEAQGSTEKAQVIADAFGVSADGVMALRDQGIGWGAIFKLYKLSAASGVDVAELAASSTDQDGSQGFSFGQRFRDLTDDQRDTIGGLPKNLGQAVSEHHGHR